MRLTKEKVRKVVSLRKKGYSIPEISRECYIAKSTVLRKVRGVKILSKYYGRWLTRRNASKIISDRHWATASAKAKKLVGSLDKKELALVGASLYWAEGSKGDFGLSNTDPELIKTFIYILKHVFKIDDKDLKISLRIYEDIDKNASLKYWSKVTGIELSSKTSVDVLRGSKNGKLRYGMCRIRVKKGGVLLKEFISIRERISDFMGPRSSTDRTAHS